MKRDTRPDFGNWQISAQLNGAERLAGSFDRTYPEDAVTRFAVDIRLRFDPSPLEWLRWKFICVSRNSRFLRIVTFARLSPSGPVLRLA